MQKKIIALAVAGLVSGVAFAQSNVTIYGVADANYYYASGDNLSRTGIDSGGDSGSRIGFKGEEALGNGLKAIFTMEYGTSIDGGDNDAALGGARQAFVGLDTSVGSFTVGRQYAPSWWYYGRNSANDVKMNMPINSIQGDLIGKWAGGTMTTGDAARWNNSIAYQSKNWSGFELRTVYSFGENTEDDRRNDTAELMDDGKFGLGVNYANGPFQATLIYQGKYNVSGAAPALTTLKGKSSNDINEYMVGASYDFKVVKLYGSYQQTDADLGNQDKQAKIYALGLGIPVSAAGTVSVELMEARYDQDNALTDGRTRGLGVGYTHSLSKRTTLYAGLGFIQNKDRDGNGSSAILGAGTNNPNTGLGYKGVGEANENNWSITTGVKHTF